jgi:hypothetical protein
MRVIERSIDKCGKSLLLSEIEIEGWWMSLFREEQQIIALYADHGTSKRVQPVVRACDAAIGWLKPGSLAADPG